MNYFEIEPEENVFKSIVVDITHKCNMKCANCYIPNRTIEDIDIQRVYELLKRLPSRVYVRLIGAEPTMREDLFQIIENVLALGHRVSLTTNGLKLADLEYCKKLKESGLKLLLISMNGADDDNAYSILDCGKYAAKKMQALENAIKLGFHVNTGTIIARGINEHVLKRQIDLIARTAANIGVRLDDKGRLPIVLRVKSVGTIGRHMQGASYEWPDFIEYVARELNISKEQVTSRPVASGSNPIVDASKAEDLDYKVGFNDGLYSSYVVNVATEVGDVFVRMINWSVEEGSCPDPGNLNRGRITQNYKLAPFFEHVKKNEFQY